MGSRFDRVSGRALASAALVLAGIVAAVAFQPGYRAAAPPLWWAGMGGYVGSMLVMGLAIRPRRPHVLGWAAAALAAFGLLVLGIWDGDGLSPILSIISAGLVCFAWSRIWVAVTLVVQSVALLAILVAGDWDWVWPLVYVVMMVFAALMVETALREGKALDDAAEATSALERANERLTQANTELAEASRRLAQRSRAEERLRIARDLHDALGHQLTALSLNLEVAGHLVQGPGASQVAECRTLAKHVLHDVRFTVSALRDPRPLTDELERLADLMPSLATSVEADPRLDAAQPLVAEAVLRIAQEGLTNAARHSGARHAWITAAPAGDEVVVEVRDDGRGTSTVVEGNGLRGMSERVHRLGGTLSWSSEPDEGFRLVARIPGVVNP